MKKLLLISLGALMMASCAKDKKDYDATGTFEATEVTVSAESTGQLENFNVTEGQVLNGGLTVGQIDARQLTLKREQLTSSNEQLAATHGQLAANKRQLAANQQATSSKQLDLKKQVAAIRQQIANQQRERQRFAELLQDGAVARKQVDDIDYQIQVLLKQLAATEEQISSQNTSLAEQNKGITISTRMLRMHLVLSIYLIMLPNIINHVSSILVKEVHKTFEEMINYITSCLLD